MEQRIRGGTVTLGGRFLHCGSVNLMDKIVAAFACGNNANRSNENTAKFRGAPVGMLPLNTFNTDFLTTNLEYNLFYSYFYLCKKLNCN